MSESVTLLVATPASVKAAGAGWRINAGVSESPFGHCLIAECPKGICHLSFFQPVETSNHWKKLQSDWPNASLERDDEWASALSEQIFRRDVQSLRPLKVYAKGTAFQIKVWRALVQIPHGRTVSYGELAAQSGNPKAVRAVGTAVGNNPVGFLIPCHRVIRESGAMGGYRWGIERKRAILTWES